MLDNQIRQLRKRVRNLCKAANYYYMRKSFSEYRKLLDQCYSAFEELDRNQRIRFQQVGSFLPAANGKVYAYNYESDLWLKF